MAHSLYDITPLEPLIRDGYVLLTPNYRLARRIKAQWDASQAASGARTWEPLTVHPLERWLQTQWDAAVQLDLLAPLLPLGTAQEAQLWQQVIRAQENSSGDYHLLRPSVAAELARSARDTLLRYEVVPQGADTRQLFKMDLDCQTFLTWLEDFELRLRQDGFCTAADCIAQLPALEGQLHGGKIALVEFDEIAPLSRHALAALCDEVREIQPEPAAGQRLVHPFNDKRDELQAVARWAASLHTGDPQATIGIVLGDTGRDRISLEYLLRREFDCLGEKYTNLPVNFSTGISLSQAPVVRDALAALEMGLSRTTVPAVVALQSSRFLDLPDANSALAQRLVTRLYARGHEELDIAELRNLASRIKLGEQQGLSLGNRLLSLSRQRELNRKAEPSEWAGRFSTVLDVWGWPGTQALDSLEYQQVELWYRTLEQFKAYDSVCATLDYPQALQLLREVCAQQMSQPQTVDSSVQVLGPLEAAGLNFDHLWLCGMQGSSWPAPARPNPFIPLSLQSRLDMPHATPARELAFSEGLIRQYMSSCNSLHASYCRLIDGVPELPSALLEAFEELELPSSEILPEAWQTRQREAVMDSLDDAKAPDLTVSERDDIHGGSGLLEDQSQCPFRAFARRRLQVEPLGEFSVALSAAERGSLLHDALYILWGELKDHASLLALDAAAETALVERAVRSAIDEAPAHLKHGMGGAYWGLEGRRMTTLLCEWLDVERARGEFCVLQREAEVILELVQLQIKLRVDRIDRLPEGERVIIDYKSGTSKVQDWLGRRPAKPQLLLYGLAVGEDIPAALAFAQVRPRDSRYVGLGSVAAAAGISTDIPRAVGEKMDATDWDSLNQQWAQVLQSLAQAFVEGRAAVDPLADNSCAWCGLQPLCRIDIDTPVLAEDES